MKNNLWSRLTSVFWPRNSISDWPEENPANPHRINGGVNGSRALMFSGCWAATNTIAGIFGALPSKVYKKTEAGREEATDHNLYRILTREPNPEMDSFVFWEMLTQWWVNYGNAFAEIQRRENSRQIVALHPIHPSRVYREKKEGKYTGRWGIRNEGEQDSVLEADEMFNIVGALSDDGVIGKGVLHYASKTIATALAEQGYRADFYANGGRPSGVLEHPGKLSTEARDNLRREWKTVHGRGNEIAILWENMKFNPSSVAPEHAEIINSSVFSIQEMARFYDVPPNVLYDLSHGTFANVEEMNRYLVSHPLNRRMVRVEKACDRQLFSDAEKRAGYYVKFNVNALLRGNPKEQAEINQIKLQCGRLSVDEWRQQDDENKLPDGLGNHYFMRRDMAPTELVIEAAKKSIEETTPIVPTPETPDTPPALGNWVAKAEWDSLKTLLEGAQDDVRRLGNQNVRVTEKLLAAESEIEGWKEKWGQTYDSMAKATEHRDELDAALGRLVKKHDAEQIRAEEAESKVSALESALIDREHAIKAHVDTIASLTQERDAIAATVETITAERDNAHADVRKLTASAEQDAAAYLEACEQRDSLCGRLDTATKSLTESENAIKLLREAAQQDHNAHAEALAAATRRTEEIKAEADTLAREVGALRAECDGLKQQRGTIDGERMRSASEVTELRQELQAAATATAKARQDAENTKQEAQSTLSGAKDTVSASIRGLLDASLDSLLWKERSQVKDCSRNYDRFKELANAFYLTFTTELTAHLQQAADAMESVGQPRVDVAKVAAEYVAESRKRLNIAFNGSNKSEIRSVIRQEVDGWERKEELTRIGE